MSEKKKFLVRLDIDNPNEIRRFQRLFLEEQITVISKKCCEIWEIDELNNMKKIF